MNFSPQNALLISALAGGGAYAAYKYNLLPKKVAAYSALGIIALAFIATEVDSLSSGIPTVLAGAGVIGIALLIL